VGRTFFSVDVTILSSCTTTLNADVGSAGKPSLILAENRMSKPHVVLWVVSLLLLLVIATEMASDECRAGVHWKICDAVASLGRKH
jgi:hypothetical protein